MDWARYLVRPDGSISTEFAVVCTLLVLFAWIGVAAEGAASRTAIELHHCAVCDRVTGFRRRPGAWVPVAAGLSWGALFWSGAPSLARWIAPFVTWGVLVGLHPKRCALCNGLMGIA